MEAQRPRAPLLRAVSSRSRRPDAALYVPGHKRGRGAHLELVQLLGEACLKADLTELPGLDNLQAPVGAIAEAQDLAAELYGAYATHFCVNGTTAGVHAAVLALAGQRGGAQIAVARDCHASVLSACVLSGAMPVWVDCELDERLGIAHPPAPWRLRQVLEEHPDLAGAVVTSPTYFGAVADVGGLAGACHDQGIPLVVDEAHGAHLGFHAALPRGALANGADLAVQSSHKTLSALTQGSMLHVGHGARVDPARVARALRSLQSSSPSYLLLASLDAARLQLAEEAAGGPGFVRYAVEVAQHVRRELADTPGIRFLDAASVPGSVVGVDETRLTLDVTGLGADGFAIAAELDERFDVVAELATPRCVVFVLTGGNTMRDADMIVDALRAVSMERGGDAGHMPPVYGSAWLEMAMTPRDAFFADTETVPLGESVGRVAAESACPYPPGIPAVVPGAIVSQGAVDQLSAVLEMGGVVTGARDPTLATLEVVRHHQ